MPTPVPNYVELLALPDSANIKFGHAFVLLRVSRPHSYGMRKNDALFREIVPVFDIAGTKQANVGDIRRFLNLRRQAAIPAPRKPGRPRNMQAAE